jgi:hypothetical protein
MTTKPISFGEYMAKIMEDIKQEMSEREIENRYFKRMHFNNLVRRAKFMGDVPARKRLSQQIAESLIESHGAFSHIYALEHIEKDEVTNSQLWRDVLSWLDKLGENDVRGNTGDADRIGREGEQSKLSETHSTNDAETTRPVSLHDGADGIGQ